MTPVTCMAGRRLALFGLGGSGLATLAALEAGGADVVAFDDREAGRAMARELGHTVSDLRELDWSRFDALVLAPGVPLTHPAPHWTVERARAAGVAVIGDIELFCRERAAIAPGAPFVAITGTNGKSTTTALVAHILRQAGRDVQMGGNIGTAILSLAPPSPDRVHVIEMSSFQIDLTPSFGVARPDPSPAGEGESAPADRGEASPGRVVPAPVRSFASTQPSPAGEGSTGSGPTVGVLLNITPDHLDRHGTMENYAAIKRRILDEADDCVVMADDDWTLAIAREKWGPKEVGITLDELPPAILETGSGDLSTIPEHLKGLDAWFVGAGTTLYHSNVYEWPTSGFEELAEIRGIPSLRGRHNLQNALAAWITTAWLLKVPEPVVNAALRTFPGLPHRMEQAGHTGRVLFVNDSKATNADSAEKALLSFDSVHWILGGKAKEGGIAPLRPLFGKVAKAYLIGEATEPFAATLRESGVAYERCVMLDRAVAVAAADAAASDAPEPVVLLSPACASYDQFPNFEVRGDRFRDLVRALPGWAPGGG